MTTRDSTELITNINHTIYHLGLLPEHVAKTVLTVGDPDRIDLLLPYFSKIYYQTQRREFRTVFGVINGKDVTLISTGIGTDNIDIVINELDFLVNWDLKILSKNDHHKSLKIIRLGTSGSAHSSVELESVVYSKYALSADGLFDFYDHSFDKMSVFNQVSPVIGCDKGLEGVFQNKFKSSFTLTTRGFYGPQMRSGALDKKFSLSELSGRIFKGMPIGNIEMETAGIYGLSSLLGHQAISINAILADRITGEFSSKSEEIVQKMIANSMELITEL